MTPAYVNTLAPAAQERTYVNFLVYQDPACTNAGKPENKRETPLRRV